MAAQRYKVLILGGGFGGVKVALELAGQPHYEIGLISDSKDFRFYPALFHAATGGRSSASSIPLREIFGGKKIKLVADDALHLDRNKKLVVCRSGKKYAYDSLIIALGVVTNYFGIKGLKEYSYGLKTLEEARELRNHLHKLMLDTKSPDLNYVVIGGGATGVEMAGALPAYLKHIMKKHALSQKNIHVDLVEAESRLMPTMSRHYSYAVAKRLRQLGVQLHLHQKVEAETADKLMVSGHPIASHTVIWTAGVTNHPFFSTNKFNLSSSGKVIVNELLQAEDDIYVIGDNAATAYSGLAQTALHDAIFVTENLRRLSHGRQPLPYKPRKPVYVTPVGRHWAAAAWRNLYVYGWLGWILREAADFVAYHDLEPWWKSSKHWLAEYQSEETCPVCAKK